MLGLESKIRDIYHRRINYLGRMPIFLLAATGLAFGSFGCESDSSTTQHKNKEDTPSFASWPDDKKQDILLYSDTCQNTFFPDKDGDGYGDKGGNIFACEKPAGYVDNFLDCDDNNLYIAPSAKELCDLKDNNCDNVIDESGACICIDNDFDGFFLYSANDCPIGNDCDDKNKYIHPNMEEVSDGTDNDCDGSIDEGFSCNYGATQKCGFTDIGKCEYGTQTCTNGTWGPCLGEIKSMSEECDYLDNNCDGKTDENLTKACSSVCGSGVETCANGSWLNCDAPTPVSEICDGKDNDCDGKIDESIEKYISCGPNGDGQQKQVCNNNSWVNSGSCLGGGTCKNGETLDQLCGSDTGECQKGTQYKTCSNGQWGSWGACQGEVKSKNETCNNKDDDCDASIDESLTQTCSSVCGSGIETCVGGVWKNCSAPQPSAEVCDDKDNDCDGSVDEEDICPLCNEYDSSSYYLISGKCCTDGQDGGKMCVVNSISYDLMPNMALGGLTWDGQYLWFNIKNCLFMGSIGVTFKTTVDGIIEKKFNSPGMCLDGLGWDGQYLWAVDDAWYGENKIYKLSTNGQIINSFSSPINNPWGLAWVDQQLYVSDWKDSVPGGGKIYKITTSGQVVDSLEFGGAGFKPLGLAWDGQFLWVVDINTVPEIHKLTSSGTIINTFEAPMYNQQDVAWDGQYLWSTANTTIYKLEIIE